MQHEPRTRNSVLWWLAPIAFLLLLEPPIFLLLGRFLFPFMILFGSAVCMAHWTRAALRGGQGALAEPFAAEEGEHRRRLAELRAGAEQMELTLKDLRSLQFTPEQATRARWAEVDLEGALRRTRAQMAHERGSLYALESMRWFGKLEPLLRDLHRMDEPEITRWLGKLETIRTQGAGILTRLRTDAEAVEAKPGRTAAGLLEEALREIEVLRGDLVTRRAELLARWYPAARPDPAGSPRFPAIGPLPGEASLHRLRDRLYEVRAHREIFALRFEDGKEQG